MDYLTVNYPNIPVLGKSISSPEFGKFITTPEDPQSQFTDAEASVTSLDMYLPNFSLRVMEGQYFRETMFINKQGIGADLPGSCVFLKGKVRSILQGQSESIELLQRQQNFKYDPENEFRHLVPSQNPFRFLHFSYTKELLSTILPEGERWAEELLNNMNLGRRVAGGRSITIDSVQERALQTIFNNPLEGKLGLMMLEAAMMQIILIQLDGLFRNAKDAAPSRVGRRDVETIHAVKEYLHDSFLDEHSLAGLARRFGMNTNKLMNSFKTLFGKSIFGFIQDLRMDYARQLLLEHDLQITEVARTIGYKNPNHFSAAFKRQFGFCPSEMRS